MLLTGNQIAKGVRLGHITIEPFIPENVGPNSYDVRLADKLLVYTADVLDMKKENPTRVLEIPPEGLLLQPGTLYLGSTIEKVGSDRYVPWLDGRSSVGRLGLFLHCTAGRGDISFCSDWTLEISVVEPLRVYAGIRIGQFSFFNVDQKEITKYVGKYGEQSGPQPSRMWRDKEFQQQ